MFFADIGYWFHFDWTGLGGIFGEPQTYIISFALYCTYLAMKDTYGSSSFVPEWLMLAVPAAFVGSAVLFKGLILAHLWPLTAKDAVPPEYNSSEAQSSNESTGPAETEDTEVA